MSCFSFACWRLRLGIAFWLLWCGSGSLAASLAIDDSVPEGFESLDLPRLMLVDVIFNDSVMGTTSVTVDGDSVSFDDPKQVLDRLDSVRSDDELLQVMSLPLDTHVEKLCYRPGDPVGCGSVHAEPFAVIFDEDALTLTVFVDSAFQRVRTAGSARYLEPPATVGSAILSLDASSVSVGGEPWQHELRAESWLGYGPGYLRGILNVDSEEKRARLDSLALVHRLKDHELLLGSYAFPNAPALSGFDVLGLRLSTSMNTRIDPERIRGSEISILLDRRSLVQLYVGDRLYSTQSLEAGLVAIDTADLPDGHMQVEVRIADPVSGPRVEYHRFARSTLLPPRDRTSMMVALGVPERQGSSTFLPQPRKVGVGSVRLARRTGDSAAVALGLSHLGDLDLLQPEFVVLLHDLTFQASASLGFGGELGAGVLGLWQRGVVSASLSGDWFDHGRASHGNDVVSTVSRPWIPDERAQVSATIDGLVGQRTSMGVFGSYRREGGSQQYSHSFSVGFAVRHRLYEKARMRSSLSARVRREAGEINASLDFRLTFGGSSRLTSVLAGVAGSGLSRSSGSGSDAEQTVIGIDSRWQGDLRDDWQYEGGVWGSAGSGGSTVGIDAGMHHRNFSSEFQSQWREYGRGVGNTDSAFRLSTQLVMDRGGIAFAGVDSARAGIVVAVSGEPAGAEYDIVVNSARVGTGRVGSPTFVGLPPFERYEVQLQPHALLASTIEQEGFEVTLYPGNIVRLSTEARERHLLIATVVDSRGELLGNAIVQRDEGPLMISSDGLLQLETSNGEAFDVVQEDGSACTLTMPQHMGKDEVVVLDASLVCQ